MNKSILLSFSVLTFVGVGTMLGGNQASAHTYSPTLNSSETKRTTVKPLADEGNFGPMNIFLNETNFHEFVENWPVGNWLDSKGYVTPKTTHIELDLKTSNFVNNGMTKIYLQSAIGAPHTIMIEGKIDSQNEHVTFEIPENTFWIEPVLDVFVSGPSVSPVFLFSAISMT